MKKKIAVLGSTGSIGKQALEVIENFPEKFEVEVLAAYRNSTLLIEQAKKHVPNAVVIIDEEKHTQVADALQDLPVKVFAGNAAAAQVVEMASIDMVLSAIVGYAGLMPVINAIKAGKNIALANKETLVVAGSYIKNIALENNAMIIPVDSEHSAIFQCLVGEGANFPEKVFLTASGGPFRDKTMDFLHTASPEDALRHPTWNMGNKITIDSATLMNKGLEAIEARWLFDLKPGEIEVVIHPQSIIHSVVQFKDGSQKAQMNLPDMRIPIQYALSFPERLKSGFPRYNFFDLPELTFEKPDFEKFPCLTLAYQALEKCGNMPCILNAANEIAVEAFLNKKLGFLQISEIIDQTMQKVDYIATPNLEDYVETDREARIIAENIINKS